MKIYNYYWAKASPDTVGPGYHLFPYHALDVVAVADAWLENVPALKTLFLNAWGYRHFEILRAWLLFFIGLHDLGKLDLSFQLKAPDVAKVLFPAECAAWLPRIRPLQPFDHGQAGYAWFVQHIPDSVLQPHDQDLLCAWMAAVAGHHGSLTNDASVRRLKLPPDLKQLDWAARESWIADLATLFLQPVNALQYETPCLPEKFLAGFCAVCDWLGSNTNYFCYHDKPPESTEDLAAYLVDRKQQAHQALRDAGLIAQPLTQGGMSQLFPEYTPKGLQKRLSELPLTPGLTVIESPTGSGKTEVALVYAAQLLAAGIADSIIFALPTQATANAMLTRLEQIAAQLFPQDGANLLLAHGKARFHERFKGLKQLGQARTPQAQEEAGVYCSQWLGSSRKRVFLGQIGVCTIDQVLLAVLPVRHHFVRTFGIGKSVLIVDEIHAYDSYMNGLLDRVLEAQARLGGSTILLSATLPAQRLQQIASRWCPGKQIQSQHYPLLSHISAAGVQQWESPDPVAPKRVEIALQYTALARPDALLTDAIIAAAQAGARVAVICNLVDDAQAMYRQLKQRTQAPVDLFHARFCFIDRMAREADVIAHYGKTAPRLSGRILVATQVIEQSLDLDFDWMITQLCPVDLLFQRLGRLHRHLRPRPKGFEQPACVVLCPPQPATEPDYGLHQLIYGHVRALWRTEQLLNKNPVLYFPDVYRDWIEYVYTEKAWPDESKTLTEAYKAYLIQQEAKAVLARNLSVSDTSPYRDTDASAARLTRDGEMALSLIPVREQAGQLYLLNGQCLSTLEEYEKDEILNLHTVPVPQSWQKYLPADEEGLYFLPMTQQGETWTAEDGSSRFDYHPHYGMERKHYEFAH